MKKIILFALAVAMFAGCKKDESEPDYSLNGTTWTNEDDGYREIKFSKTEFYFKYEYERGDYHEGDEDAGTYVYKPPFVTFKAINKDTNKLEEASGRISGNELTFGNFIYVKRD